MLTKLLWVLGLCRGFSRDWEPYQVDSNDQVAVDCSKSKCPEACTAAGCAIVTNGGGLDFCLRDLTTDCAVLLTITRFDASPSSVCTMSQRGGWAFNIPYATPEIVGAVVTVQLDHRMFTANCTALNMQMGYVSVQEWSSCAISSTDLALVHTIGNPNVAFTIVNNGENDNRYVQVRSECADLTFPPSVSIIYQYETGFYPGYLDPTTSTTTTTTITTTTTDATTSTTNIILTDSSTENHEVETQPLIDHTRAGIQHVVAGLFLVLFVSV
eukprot:Gregarina_sp_Poly_1__1034@NODE_1253_length_4621_cov_230_546552_g854_i0_p2_GENE_NODE_1253_length_4621_cov_230_546552_g854_i0NODE_1253_length_4621_cov_230_546552_g854_i0_p2_ORF_typecomplete_len270_score18_30Alpha_GJ/PF03229_13/0_017DUF1573/PF07610_11/1_6e03DUF1573/PF07610_11/0_63_NODE_1253_length_4621_cov_230_546552_g854_i03841193